jgi:surface antigen
LGLWAGPLATLSACAVVTPFGVGVDNEPTGAIAQGKGPGALPAALDAEDRRRALGALALALDPQGNGATVRWDNPVSKAHGVMTPLGYAYPANDLVCRHFSAEFVTRSGAEAKQGAACRDKNAEWVVSDLHAAKVE